MSRALAAPHGVYHAILDLVFFVLAVARISALGTVHLSVTLQLDVVVIYLRRSFAEIYSMFFRLLFHYIHGWIPRLIRIVKYQAVVFYIHSF